MRASFVVRNPDSTALRALNYSPAVEAFKGNAVKKNSVPLCELLAGIGESYGEVFRSIDCDPSFGEELISQGDMFAAEPSGRVIRRDSMPKAQNHLIHRGQVLIAGAGTLGETELYGRSIIADARLAGKYVGPHAVALTFKQPLSAISLYTYAFLCTAVGLQCIRSASYGTKVLSLRLDRLRDLPIPIASESTVRAIAALIERAIENREKYVQQLQVARSQFEAVPEYQHALHMCQDRCRRCLVWGQELNTLSAWNHASTGDALPLLREAWSRKLGDLVELNGITGGARLLRIPCSPPHGVNFLSQRDVFMIRPVPRRVVRPLVDDKWMFAAKHTILLAANGQYSEGALFGQAALADFHDEHAAITEHIFRVVPGNHHWHVLFAFLSTKLGIKLLRSTAVGTSVPKMHVGLLRQIPVPELTDEQGRAVLTHLTLAIDSRTEAALAESEAVRIIEEEVLPEWLA